ncbi:tetratricopeptide repeat protein, partial [bacterium]|nr:tetratricopeptide repeat protein [bacterium]
MITNISFCVLSYGHSNESLERCINSIRKQGVPEYEVLVCGTGSEQTCVKFYHQEEWASLGEINKMRNHLCGHASNEFIVLIDASIELTLDWYINIKQADCYDVAGCHLNNSEGERVVDWAYQFKFKDENIPLPLYYDEWSTKAYVSGFLMLIHRNVWEQVRFNENLPLNQDDDVDFCIRASKTGYRVGVFPDAPAVYHFDKNVFKKRDYITFRESLKSVCDYRQMVITGKIEYERGNYDGAIKYYTKILEIMTDNADILTDLGWAYHYKAWYDKAIGAFNEAIELDPKNNRALRGRGWAYFQKHDYGNTIKDLSEATKYISSAEKGAWQEILRGLGWSYYHKGDFDEAIQNFNIILENTSTSEKETLQEVFQGLGWSYIRKYCFDDALKYFDSAIQNIDSMDKAKLNEVLKGRDMARMGKGSN